MSALDDKITIMRSEYDELVSDSRFLDALRDAGVDNWDGYQRAVEIIAEEVE